MARRLRAGVAILAVVAIAASVVAVVSGRERARDSTRSDLPIAVPDKISLLTVDLRGTDRVEVYFGLMKESQYVAVDEGLLEVTIGAPATLAPVARFQRTITAADFRREPMDGTKFQTSFALERPVTAASELVADVAVTLRGGKVLEGRVRVGAR